MTTTELINLLKAHEFGGATGRPRTVFFEINGNCIETNGIAVTGSGDGLFTELYLSLPAAESKIDEWVPCKVRKPDKIERTYWVCLDDERQCQCRWTNNLYGFGAHEWSPWGWHPMDKPMHSNVVAWRHLPEPYKEENDDAGRSQSST